MSSIVLFPDGLSGDTNSVKIATNFIPCSALYLLIIVNIVFTVDLGPLLMPDNAGFLNDKLLTFYIDLLCLFTLLIRKQLKTSWQHVTQFGDISLDHFVGNVAENFICVIITMQLNWCIPLNISNEIALVTSNKSTLIHLIVSYGMTMS